MELAEKLLAELSDLSPEALNLLGEQLQRVSRVLLGHAAQISGQPETVESEDQPETPTREEPPRSVGRFGIVTMATALSRAQQLGEFTRSEFAEKLGLKMVAVSKWITALTEAKEIEYTDGRYRCLSSPPMRDWVVEQRDPFELQAAAEATKRSLEDALEELRALAARGIVESADDEVFEYKPPDDLPSPRERPRRMPPEKERPAYSEAKATGMPVRVAASKKATRAQRSTAGAGGVKGPKQRDRRFNDMMAKKEERAEQRKAKAQQQPGFKSRNNKRR